MADGFGLRIPENADTEIFMHGTEIRSPREVDSEGSVGQGQKLDTCGGRCAVGSASLAL